MIKEKQKKTVGIIGGMGPKATYDLAQKIIDNTKASRDQEHLHVIVDCNTDIPDRTEAILYGGEDPRPELIKSAKSLVAAGAELLVMPCNTAHFFYGDIQSEVTVPMINMPNETAAVVSGMGIKNAGVLATEGTIKSKVYEDSLKTFGVNAIYPDDPDQDIINDIIYKYIKAGNYDFDDLLEGGAVSKFGTLLTNMEAKSAEVLILACTELPIAFDLICSQHDARVWEFRGEGLMKKVVDPGKILAISTVKAAGAVLK